jgi:glycerol uptake facilitator-like aquaporin|mmetsp:Transcript_615/g.815  ORF Transcript_615/g.815 Transcript_615/m.815 type:complete len:119 (+) Transcript_615:492-848(+)|eukprot:CAMPEP_0185582550 /NCGR_PEP_ID=MMETSP0434-20130131/20960_1 /TAXON_ID=626734 ORGANISM="Favella taraikaensis, Strain Fe Narragansett Bay" /NCGR_SAMPLE_ID=MMETSP0434 /ASSEMBLY_ACC=CAM_ASM_000379 /LENGTH=118 /DNA_ID=CAMNT_0028201389 /DNA_START=486 /DNA_END=842 /DNA_ORIENTATION=-
MRALFQELLCSFIFVFFFMTNTDEKLAFSNEKAINCFILAASYVGARAMFAGNLSGSGKYAVTTYGAVMNPAIALGIQIASLFNLGFDAWKAVYLYPTVPFGAAFLSVLFYELIYKKT